MTCFSSVHVWCKIALCTAPAHHCLHSICPLASLCSHQVRHEVAVAPAAAAAVVAVVVAAAAAAAGPAAAAGIVLVFVLVPYQAMHLGCVDQKRHQAVVVHQALRPQRTATKCRRR